MTSLTSGQPISRSQGRTLSMQLVDLIRQKLRAGEYPPGTFLPSIQKLSEDFGVSRVTVREAVRVLERERLLVSEQGRGTMVTAVNKGQRPLVLCADLAAFAESLRDDSIDITTLEGHTSKLPLPKAEGLSRKGYRTFRRIHSRDGLRYCAIHFYVDREVFDRAPDRFRRELALPVLWEICREDIAEARQRLSFGKCDQATSQLLRYPAGDPVALVRRQIFDRRQRVLYLGDTIYRADILEVHADFST